MNGLKMRALRIASAMPTAMTFEKQPWPVEAEMKETVTVTVTVRTRNEHEVQNHRDHRNHTEEERWITRSVEDKVGRVLSKGGIW